MCLDQVEIAGYSGCQKNVAVFKRFFLQPYNRLYPHSVIRNISMESGIKLRSTWRNRLLAEGISGQKAAPQVRVFRL